MRVLEMIFSAAGVMSVSYEVKKILTCKFDMITIYFQVKPLQEGKEKFVSVIQKFPGGYTRLIKLLEQNYGFYGNSFFPANESQLFSGSCFHRNKLNLAVHTTCQVSPHDFKIGFQSGTLGD